MLGFLVSSFLAVLVGLSMYSSFFPLVIMVLMFSLLFSITSCYSPLGGYAFIRLFSRADSLGVLLAGLRV